MRPPDVCGQLGMALVVILASTAFEAVGLEVRIDTPVSLEKKTGSKFVNIEIFLRLKPPEISRNL